MVLTSTSGCAITNHRWNMRAFSLSVSSSGNESGPWQALTAGLPCKRGFVHQSRGTPIGIAGASGGMKQ